MTNEDVVRFLIAGLDESDKVWRNVRKVMEECYLRYKSYRDHSKKKTWQHKMVIPTVYPAIKGASGLIKKILAGKKTFFKFEPQRQDDAPPQPAIIDPNTGQPAPPMGPPDQTDNFARAWTNKVKFHLDEARFVDKLEEGIECALTMGLGILRFTPKLVRDARILWGSTSPAPDPNTGVLPYGFVKQVSERAKLECDVVNPLMLHYPADRSYIIEETRVYLHELVNDTSGMKWNRKEMGRLKREDYETTPETDAEITRRKVLNIFDHKNPFRKSVVLHIFHGDLTDEDGKLVMRGCRFIVANKKYLILKPEVAPYWRRDHTYVFITPMKILFSVLGAGMIDGIRPIINAIDNLANIMGDKLLYLLLPPNEINTSMLVDQEQAEGGLVPGKSFKTKGIPGKAINVADVGSDIPSGGLVFIEALKKFVQNYTGWTEFMQGMPTAKGQVTATEVEKKTEAGSLQFDTIASNIENDAIVESIEIAQDLTIQFFMDFKLNPETEDIFKQEGIDIRNLAPAQQFSFLNKRYPLKLEGLQAFFEKEKERQDMIQLGGILSNVPSLSMRLNGEEFLKRLFSSFPSWRNPEQLILKLDQYGMLVDHKGQRIPVEAMMAMAGGGRPSGAAGPLKAGASPGAPQLQ